MISREAVITVHFVKYPKCSLGPLLYTGNTIIKAELVWGSEIPSAQLEQSISSLQQLDELPEIRRENLVNLPMKSGNARKREIACNLPYYSSLALQMIALSTIFRWSSSIRILSLNFLMVL